MIQLLKFLILLFKHNIVDTGFYRLDPPSQLIITVLQSIYDIFKFQTWDSMNFINC